MNFQEFSDFIGNTKKLAEQGRYEEVRKALSEDDSCRKEAAMRLRDFAAEIERLKFSLITEKRASEIVACSMQQLYARLPRDAASRAEDGK